MYFKCIFTAFFILIIVLYVIMYYSNVSANLEAPVQVRDTALNWIRLGSCGNDMTIFHLVVNPFDTQQIWVATGNGIWRCIIAKGE